MVRVTTGGQIFAAFPDRLKLGGGWFGELICFAWRAHEANHRRFQYGAQYDPGNPELGEGEPGEGWSEGRRGNSSPRASRAGTAIHIADMVYRGDCARLDIDLLKG